MIKHITLNFTVDRVGGLVSIIATRRKPTDNERDWADWTDTVIFDGAVYHCLGRGDQLSNATCMLYAGAHLNQAKIWKSVNLSVLDGK